MRNVDRKISGHREAVGTISIALSNGVEILRKKRVIFNSSAFVLIFINFIARFLLF